MIKDGGTDCVWDALDMCCPLSRDELTSSIIELAVKNASGMGSAQIGVGSLAIKRALTNFGNVTDITVDLQPPTKAAKSSTKDTDTKPSPSAGRVVLSIQIKAPDPAPVLDPKFVTGMLKISKIRGLELKKSAMIGSMCPSCSITIGPWSDKTHTLDDGGSNVMWDYLDMSCDVDAKTVQSVPIEVALMDENMTAMHALVGRGTCTMLPCGARLGTEVELHVEIKDDKKRECGRITLFASLQQPITPAHIEIPPSFVNGTLTIKKANVTGLSRQGWGLSASMVLTLSFGGEWKKETKSAAHTDTVQWDPLNLEVPSINPEALRTGEIVVEAFDKRSLQSKVSLGTAHLSILPSVATVGKPVTLRGEFRDHDDHVDGRIVLEVVLNAVAAAAREVEVDIGLPKTFSMGCVTLSRIHAKGLENKEYVGNKVR